MNFRQLRYFVAVADLGGFSAASRSLSVSQPALGAQVRLLEEGLGVTLLERRPRGVAVTEAGRLLRAQADRILAEVQHAADLMAPFRAAEIEELVVGVTPSSACVLPPDVLDGATGRRDGARVALRRDFSPGLIAQVEAREIDLAICYDARPSDHYVTVKLFREELFLVGLPEICGPGGEPVTLGELERFPLVIAGRSRGARPLIDRVASRHGLELDIAFEVEATGLKRDLLHRHRCCTIVSYMLLLEDIMAGAFNARPIAPPGIARDCTLVYRADLAGPAFERLMAAIAEGVARRVAAGTFGWRRIEGEEDRGPAASADAGVLAPDTHRG